MKLQADDPLKAFVELTIYRPPDGGLPLVMVSSNHNAFSLTAAQLVEEWDSIRDHLLYSLNEIVKETLGRMEKPDAETAHTVPAE